MDSLMEALQSGAAFRDRRKRNPRNGNCLQLLIFKHVTSLCRVITDPIMWLTNFWTCTASPLSSTPYLCLGWVKPPVPSGIGSDDLFLLSLFFLCFIAIITAGDQSPSSPASRWPGANYGNRTLGACLSGPDALLLHSCWLQHHSFVLSKPPNWAGLQHAESL